MKFARPGVNCTGSCSWKVYVRTALSPGGSKLTTSVGPRLAPVRGPRLPRGAASRGTLTPTRLNVPIRGPLLEMLPRGKGIHASVDPSTPSVRPAKRSRYVNARGKGRFDPPSTWAEALELMAAAHVHTIKYYGPDRSTRLHPDSGNVHGLLQRGCSGYIQLMGGVMTSFYDWYADSPVASTGLR